MPDNVKKSVRKLFEKIDDTLTFDNIKHYYEKIGWTVLFYNPGAGDKVLETLGVNPPKCGMCYKAKNARYIFVDAQQDEFQQLETILHEAGHIELNHAISDKRENVQELEANAFASAAIKMRSGCKGASRTKYRIIIACISALLVLSLGTTTYFANRRMQPAPPSIPAPIDTPDSVIDTTIEQEPLNQALPAELLEEQKPESTERIYVTPEGSKYHKSGCYYIAGKETGEMTIEEARQGYLPCRVCFGNN